MKAVMEVQPNSFVSGALAAVLRLSRLAGIAPLRFVKKKTGWRIFPSSSWNVYGYILMSIFNLMNLSALISELLLDQEKTVHMRTKTRRMVWIVQITLIMVTAGTAVCGAPKQMRCMITCLNHVQKINSELNIQHRPITREIKVMLLFWLIFTVTLALVDYVVMIFSTLQNYGETWVSVTNFFYYCCYWTMQLREMQFIVITLHVKYIFEAVNLRLRSLLQELSNDNIVPFYDRTISVNKEYKRFNNYVYSTAESVKTNSDGLLKSTCSHHENVRRLALAYTSACDLVRDVDRTHGLIVLITLFSLLLHLVCTPYYFITNMFEVNVSQDWTINVINVMLQLFWCFFHTFNLVMIIEPCHLTHMEMATTRELVSHMMRSTHSIYEPLAVELELFFMQLILNEVNYKPLQVTTMTRALVVTILGSITTYLVVIIQL